ncbi:YjjG family noncanonical pyrimidine nucleotidase [Robertmurraya korlensis]|uniref:YjjG family noncanonical pyrimidine nucleotidase n=1 Tax=Robertmurraya korlensis TaxID=519977 RepID=UPI00082440F9|nr:YjjG family noncanonical pyrimidine nucleotidase [Robertmurraya korlensis]
MKTYKYLFFDIDDTLLDFQATEKEALRSLFAEQNMVLTSEDERRYKEINQSLWNAYENGKIERDEVLNTRFSTFFKQYNLEVDGSVLEKKYRSYLEQGHQLIDGAMELIMELHPHYELYIVTNGVSKTQDRRLRDSGLYPYFKKVFVSEDTGFQKPMKEFFDYVFDRIPSYTLGHGLIIGDSLSADIKGGQLSGIDTCWYNPLRKVNQSGVNPTYEIQHLKEIHEILPSMVKTSN